LEYFELLYVHSHTFSGQTFYPDRNEQVIKIYNQTYNHGIDSVTYQVKTCGFWFGPGRSSFHSSCLACYRHEFNTIFYIHRDHSAMTSTSWLRSEFNFGFESSTQKHFKHSHKTDIRYRDNANYCYQASQYTSVERLSRMWCVDWMIRCVDHLFSGNIGRSIKSVSSSWNLELIRYQLCLRNLIITIIIRVMRINSMTTIIKINCYIFRYIVFVFVLYNTTWESDINLNFISVKMHYYLLFSIYNKLLCHTFILLHYIILWTLNAFIYRNKCQIYTQ